MTELEGRALIDGEFITARLKLDPTTGRITRIEPLPAADADASRLIVPGLIDLHVHGFAGAGPLDDLEGMARGLALAGTTAFQPTLFPAEPARLGEIGAGVWTRANELNENGDVAVARILGLHAEGPFVNPEAAGALPRADLAEPSVAGLRDLLGPATGDGRGWRTLTLAPELPGAADLVRELVRSDVRVSLGHSHATAAEARRACRAGAHGATHLFNAMAPLHHREVGLAGASLLFPEECVVEIIGDLNHVSAEAFELALNARGPDGLALVSDALRGAGTGCDVFHSDGREHIVRDGTAYYPATPRDAAGENATGEQLAGSASSQLEMVRKLTRAGVCSQADAFRMASAAPAKALGLQDELGRLAEGARADVLVLGAADLCIEAVYVGGVGVAI